MNTRIKELCIAANVTTAYQLQKLCDISPSQATRLFNDKVEAISLSVLKTLCNRLKCSPNDLFGYDVASASVPELSKAQSAPVSNVESVRRRLKELSSGNVKASNGALVVSDNVASDNEKLLSTSEVSEQLGISERTVRDNYVNGKLAFVKRGTKNLVRESDFIAFRDSRNSA
jgi:excisionase family DNA binding protein